MKLAARGHANPQLLVNVTVLQLAAGQFVLNSGYLCCCCNVSVTSEDTDLHKYYKSCDNCQARISFDSQKTGKKSTFCL